MDAKLQQKVARAGQADLVIECVWDRKPAAAVFAPDRLVFVGLGRWHVMEAPYGDVEIIAREAEHRKVRVYYSVANLVFADPKTAHRFDTEVAQRAARIKEGAVDAPVPFKQVPFEPIPPERVTTLAEVPGHQIMRVVGVISELSAASGLTATSKGNDALDVAMGMLRQIAAERGANAIVGLGASTFGARGGVTSVFGGDAVGVLLVGTAVVVQPNVQPE